MTTRWIVAAALLAASVGGTAADAAPKAKAKPKAWREVYEVWLSGWAAVENPGTVSCLAAPKGSPAKSVRTVVLKHPGTLSARISGFVGSWEVAIYRGGTLIQRGGGGGVGNVTSTVYAGHYVDTSPRYEVHVCNTAGLAHGVVTLTYTPGF